MFSIYRAWSRIKPGPERPRPVSESKHLLRGVGHVEEAVLVLVVLVDLGHGEGHAGQPAVVDEQVEGLGGQQGHPVPEDNQNHIRTWNPTTTTTTAALVLKKPDPTPAGSLIQF